VGLFVVEQPGVLAAGKLGAVPEDVVPEAIVPHSGSHLVDDRRHSVQHVIVPGPGAG
jgi:hypothetical protein